jgi:Tol biopolymer transport system component
MLLAPGAQLGPYEIHSALGAGGMGEVYRALDTRLGRQVAIKILPESFANDVERLRRFELEAQSVASLSHPNIIAIYDVGSYNGTPFLVEELLEGESLREMLERGALPQRKVIDYGVQIAQGLAAAHEKGFVHRDLKPENLFITRDGRAKILDFGLAKAVQRPHVQPDVSTMAGAATAAGVVMGTASYMAPEQVRGGVVDARTDIFALGAVIYEMLYGRKVFHRETTAETMTAVLKDDLPEIAEPPMNVAPALERIVRRCLEKSPDQRFQSAKDLSFALAVLSGSEISSAARASQAAPLKSHKAWLWIALVCLAVVAVGLLTALVMRQPAAESRMEFAIPVVGEVAQPAISRDGRMLAFISPDEKSGSAMLFVQQVGSPNVLEIPGTNGASYPFWSPDGEYVAFFAGGKLQKVSAKGGVPQVLAKVTYPRGGSWGSKNVILYAPSAAGSIWQVNADGTGAASVTDKLDEIGAATPKTSHRWPLFLPDGEHYLFLFAEFGTGTENTNTVICLASLGSTKVKKLVAARSNAAYADGHLFFVDEKKSLRALPLDIGKGAIEGEARAVVDAVGYQPSVYWAAFTVADNATVIYNRTAASAQSQLTWYDRSGKVQGHIGEVGVQANPMLSPNGDRVALDITSLKENNLDIWIQDANKSTSTRLTFASAEETDPVFSRDGSSIAFRSNVRGSSLYVQKTLGVEPGKNVVKVGSGAKGQVLAEGYDLIPNSWSPDGKEILCSLQSSGTGSQLLLVTLADGASRRFLNTLASESNGMISSDGKWVAYASDESGDWEVYVTMFPAGTGKWQVSRGGGNEPRWRADGKELYFLSPTGLLMSVSVDVSQGFTSGPPVALFQVHGRPPISSTDLFTYDVVKDGSRFLVNEYVKPEQVTPLTIVQHALADPTK